MKLEMDHQAGCHAANMFLDNLKELAGMETFVTSDMASRCELLKEFIARNSSLDLVYMVDKNGVQCTPNVTGKHVLLSYKGDGNGVNRSDRAWYLIPSRTHAPYISRKYISVATGQLCMTISAPVLQTDGELIGVLAADLPVFL